MKPDPQQLTLFDLGKRRNRMEVTDGQKEKKAKTPKRKGFTSSADVHLGEEVEVSISGEFVVGKVTLKNTDLAGTTTFRVDVLGRDRKYHNLSFRLGELYRRMK